MTDTYTQNLTLVLPDFDVIPWHDKVNGNFQQIDAMFGTVFGLSNIKGVWQNSTAVLKGQRWLDEDDGLYYQALVAHTTAAAPTTFAEDRTANPTYWQGFASAEVQAYDEGLTSIAGLSIIADRMLYTTGVDTFALTPLTAQARALLDDTTATAMRSTLGAQTASGGLDTYAANSLATGELQQLQNIGTATISAAQWGYLGATTAFGASLMDDASASAGRTTLGLGTIATQASSNVTITGGSVSGITDLAIADGGTGASSASAARTNLGLGTIATQNSNNVTITGGSVSGITDLAIADGGTGASTAFAARANLGAAPLVSPTFTGTVTAPFLNLERNNPFVRFDDTDTSNNASLTLDNANFRIAADEDNAVAGSQITMRVDGAEKARVTQQGFTIGNVNTRQDSLLTVKGTMFGASFVDAGTGGAGVFLEDELANQAYITMSDAGNLFLGVKGSAGREIIARDSAGNETTISPHSTRGWEMVGGPSESMAWAYYSRREESGVLKEIAVDMLKALRVLEQLSGETLIYEVET